MKRIPNEFKFFYVVYLNEGISLIFFMKSQDRKWGLGEAFKKEFEIQEIGEKESICVRYISVSKLSGYKRTELSSLYLLGILQLLE